MTVTDPTVEDLEKDKEAKSKIELGTAYRL